MTKMVSINEHTVFCPYCGRAHVIDKRTDLEMPEDRVCDNCTHYLEHMDSKIGYCELCFRASMVVVSDVGHVSEEALISFIGENRVRPIKKGVFNVCMECAPVWFNWTTVRKNKDIERMFVNWPLGRCVRFANNDMIQNVFFAHVRRKGSFTDHAVVVTSGAELNHPYFVSQPYQYDKEELNRFKEALNYLDPGSSVKVKDPEESFYLPGSTCVIEIRLSDEYSTHIGELFWDNIWMETLKRIWR